MSYTPNPNRAAQLAKAIDGGLFAAASFAANDVRRRYRERNQGYTSGEYATVPGGVHATVTISKAFDDNGVRKIAIGTNKRSPEGFSYPLAWELGFAPAAGVFSPGLGTGRLGPTQFRRVETWRPALDDNADKLRAIFARVTKRALGRTP